MLTRNRIVPENSRQATQDTVLPLGGGEDGKSPALIEKGQLLAWSSYSMHLREDLYGEDAAEFRPERWLDDTDEKGLRVGWEYLPFNGGPRICIGRKSTLTVLDSLLEHFSLWRTCGSKHCSERLLMRDETQNNSPSSSPHT